jgi:hypothetical protein
MSSSTGHVMEPLVLVEGEFSASLDGITLDGQLNWKLCLSRRTQKLLLEAKAGRVPVHVYWQMQTNYL